VPTPTLLNYDDLPPGSDIRRVYEEGAVRITVPPGAAPPAAISQAAHEALARGAKQSIPLLLLAGVVFYQGIRINRIGGTPLVWAWAFFGVFCTAMVLLVAWVRYSELLDGMRVGRRQMTVIAATSQRLLVETAGPFGAAELDLPRDQVVRIGSERGVLRDDRGQSRRVTMLSVTLTDGKVICLLPGRDVRELHSIARTLRRTLDLAPVA